MANDVKIKVTADGIGEVEKGLGKVADSLEDVGDSSKKAEAATGSLEKAFDKQKMAANALSAALGAIITKLAIKLAGAIKDLGAEVFKEADNFRKFGESIGMTAAEVAGFNRSISLAGGSAEAFQMAMQGVASALDPEKPSEQRQALERLGVSLRDANGLYVSQKEALFRISDAFAKETDTVKKSNIAREAFGKAGKEMIVFLSQGREELEKQVKAYGDASGYTDEYARNVEQLNDSLAKAEISAKGALAALTDTDLFKSAIKFVSDLSDEWVEFLGGLKIQKAIDEATDLNAQMGKYTDKVTEIELKRAKKGTKGYFKRELDELKKGLPAVEAGAARVNGIVGALKKAKSEGADSNVIRRLNEELEAVKLGNKMIREQANLDEKVAAETAKNELKRKKAAQAEIDNAPQKKKAEERYAGEMKALDGWLANYKKSKMTETQTAEAAHKEQIRAFNELLANEKISYDEFAEYIADSEAELNLKLHQIRESTHAEAVKQSKAEWDAQAAKWEEEKRIEKNAQEQMLRIREACAVTDAERDVIAIERINQKYNEELKLAKENGIAEAEIERAKLAEIEAIKRNAADKDAENRKAAQEFSWQLRETAAADEEERCNVQMERMNARYDAELEKARGNAALITEIERARVAEAERLENQLLQTRLNATGQYLNSFMTIAQSMATIGKAGGNTMKAIAITQAIINTALAATKALSSAPPPLNYVLATATTAAGMAQVATIKSQKFAKGGVVEGNSYYGDYVPVKANSGEMILNKEQQKELFKIANGGKESGGSPIVVNFSPQIAAGVNAEDVKKMLRENQSLFRSFFASEISKGLSSAGIFV